jgi:hypothetical protein
MLSKKCQRFQHNSADSIHHSPLVAVESKPADDEPDAFLPGLSSGPQSVGSYLGTFPIDSTLSAADLQEPETCPGALVGYGISMFSHYPWHLHDTEFLEYELSFIEPKGRLLRVKSPKCLGKAPGEGSACRAWNQTVTGRQFQDLLKRATPGSTVATSLNFQFRTHPQIRELLNNKNTQINMLQLELCSQLHLQHETSVFNMRLNRK